MNGQGKELDAKKISAKQKRRNFCCTGKLSEMEVNLPVLWAMRTWREAGHRWFGRTRGFFRFLKYTVLLLLHLASCFMSFRLMYTFWEVRVGGGNTCGNFCLEQTGFFLFFLFFFFFFAEKKIRSTSQNCRHFCSTKTSRCLAFGATCTGGSHLIGTNKTASIPKNPEFSLERYECDFHGTSNYPSFRIIRVRINRDSTC